ncbi:DUF4348 domain-containing protein [Bacteroides sp. OttesenSCG-928-F21]|nr:DUF4348 domain-containing protein [Bacteroides sp. OttesenSCG-928-F21]
MKKIIFIVILAFLLVSCGNKKKEPLTESLSADTVVVDSSLEVDSLFVPENDTLQELTPPEIVNELFDDFIFNFAQDKELQLSRIIFPLSYYKKEIPLKIEKEEWEHDSLFFAQSYYTILFDREEELDMLGDTSMVSAQVEWNYLAEHLAKKYYFQKIEGRWMLEAINLRDIKDTKNSSFFEFYHHFATDTLYQVEHIHDPLEFVTADPDDDFEVLETTLDSNQWMVFKPELPRETLTNISYGQENMDNSQTKIIQLRGIGNGFMNTLFFHRKGGKWSLYRFEEVNN